MPIPNVVLFNSSLAPSLDMKSQLQFSQKKSAGKKLRSPGSFTFREDQGLDQRGTGISSPITAATLALQGDAHRQADYLKLFRADSIVKDCEAIRKTLTLDYPTELKV
jgi:hypothetical protein